MLNILSTKAPMQTFKTVGIGILGLSAATLALEACGGGGDGKNSTSAGSGGADQSSRASTGASPQSTSGNGGSQDGGGRSTGGGTLSGGGVESGGGSVGGSGPGPGATSSTAASSTSSGSPGFCGDGQCNDGENQTTCCADCGCPSGQSCEGGSCVTNPFCGDGSCNNGETQGSCCKDCGCPSGETCQNNACGCTDGTLHFENVMPNHANYCINLNQEYTQYSAAYLTVSGQTWYLPYQGYVDGSDPIGTIENGSVTCCYLDGCVGNETCQTTMGPEPCICNAPYAISIKITTCGSTPVTLCN